jgi:signal transduction histidine kinase
MEGAMVMRLSKFISENLETILKEWEDFASSLHPYCSISKLQLRDDAAAMLSAICLDLDSYQSAQEEIDKSKGHAPSGLRDTAAESHAIERVKDGFTIEEVIAEYRALRASVLRLWQSRVKMADEFDLEDMLRFNEAIDQAITESVARFSQMVRDSQNVFLSILGHDIRNPMGAISMGTQLILSDNSLPPRHLRVAAQVLRSSERATAIISDLLDFASSHLGGGIPVALAQYDLSQECKSLVQEMRLFHATREFMEEVQENITVLWDRARMSQAISNLLANAVHHGSVKDPILFTVKVSNNDVVLVIQNKGEVISPSVLRTLFDPGKSFSMKSAAERGASETKNLGLGLYITNEIVRAHGGKIAVASTEFEGTTVTLTIPPAGTTAPMMEAK